MHDEVEMEVIEGAMDRGDESYAATNEVVETFNQKSVMSLEKE